MSTNSTPTPLSADLGDDEQRVYGGAAGGGKALSPKKIAQMYRDGTDDAQRQHAKQFASPVGLGVIFPGLMSKRKLKKVYPDLKEDLRPLIEKGKP